MCSGDVFEKVIALTTTYNVPLAVTTLLEPLVQDPEVVVATVNPNAIRDLASFLAPPDLAVIPAWNAPWKIHLSLMFLTVAQWWSLIL
ncbi:hypothetical protein Taro_007198 [Colocasia esculenta]|uniref:Uncharacterized protein n=1 Tax=Colocasia esculenta TaxID=4460 RepID=A0A843U349_COLES|nr:hypothetical protein [Colocasia esculenta]